MGPIRDNEARNDQPNNHLHLAFRETIVTLWGPGWRAPRLQFAPLWYIHSYVKVSKRWAPSSPKRSCTWGLMYRPPGNARGQSRTPCTRGCCWPGCCGQPGPGAHSSYQRGISCLRRCRAASQPAGSQWTGRRFAARQTHKLGFLSE